MRKQGWRSNEESLFLIGKRGKEREGKRIKNFGRKVQGEISSDEIVIEGSFVGGSPFSSSEEKFEVGENPLVIT
jgi:hypothetical protein